MAFFSRFVYFLIVICSGLIGGGCVNNQPPPDTVSQVSTIDALLAGVYDGDKSLHYLQRHGDFGIGTFDALDGEMVMWQGIIYQVRSDGKVYRPGLDTKTPFAAVTWFHPEKKFTLQSGANYSTITKQLDEMCPNPNLFYAVELNGDFSYMKTRSVPKQHKPYPPLVKVAANQPVFEMKDVSGIVIGFRCPAYVKGINVPGWHLHFLSDDRQRGGHILDFTVKNATAEIDELFRFYMTLPHQNSAFDKVDLGQDRSIELHEVESKK